MKIRVDQASMAGGELSPLLFARTDYARYQVALETASNVVALPEGAITRTPGTDLIGFLHNEARPGLFIDFQASRTDTYMLVFNDGFMRIYKAGGLVLNLGLPYELAHPWTDAELETLFWHQSQDVIYVAGGGKPREIRRITDTSWTITDYTYSAGPVQPLNVNKALTLTCSATTGSITITASAAVFTALHVGSVWRIDEPDFRSPMPWSASELTFMGDFRRNRGRIYECVGYINPATGALITPAPGTAINTGAIGPEHDDGDSSSAGNASASAVWRYFCDAAGYVRITGFTSSTVVTATVTRRLAPALATRATNRWYEAAWSDTRGWPTSVGIVDQTLIWTKDNETYLTQALDVNSFLTVDDADAAVQYRLLSSDGKRVQIEWAYGAGVLIVGAQAGEWVLRGQQAFDRLTASNVRNVPQDNKGSAQQRPCLTMGGIVFISADRRDLNIARYNPLNEQTEIRELTVDHRRLLAGKAQQVVYQRDPHSILWVRMANGKLAALTLKDEQDVLNAHRHEIDGAVVERIGTVQSENGDRTELWLIARKVLNGQTRRMILRMAPFFEKPDETAPTAEGAQFLDMASRYTGASATVISGLDHYNSETVAIFANGRQLADQMVTAGQITLPYPSTDVLAGTRKSYRAKTLPIELQTQSGTTKGKDKQPLVVFARVLETAGGTVSAMDARPVPLIANASNTPGQPIKLTTGLLRTTVQTASTLEAQLTFSGDDALPFTLLGWAADIDVMNG